MVKRSRQNNTEQVPRGSPGCSLSTAIHIKKSLVINELILRVLLPIEKRMVLPIAHYCAFFSCYKTSGVVQWNSPQQVIRQLLSARVHGLPSYSPVWLKIESDSFQRLVGAHFLLDPFCDSMLKSYQSDLTLYMNTLGLSERCWQQIPIPSVV